MVGRAGEEGDGAEGLGEGSIRNAQGGPWVKHWDKCDMGNSLLLLLLLLKFPSSVSICGLIYQERKEEE